MRPDPDVVAYYGRGSEIGRLVVDGVDRLELMRTKELLGERLGAPPLRVLDVGGADGRYASWLASLGHDVHLVDPVPLHIDAAITAAAAGPTFTASLGDARELDQPDQSIDVVLLLGPLYHLIGRGDRLQALAEAHRVLRPGGWLAAAAVTRFASSFDGIAKGFAADPSFRTRVLETIEAGVHRNPAHEPGQFTTTYWHRPEELRQEVEAGGFRVDDLVGVEGPGGYLADTTPSWHDPAYRAGMVVLARAVQGEPSLLGFGPHLLALATRPG